MPKDDPSSNIEETIKLTSSQSYEQSERALQSDSTLPVQRQIGDFTLLSEIARGGMGVVYRALQVKLNRLVALKMIRHSDFASTQDRERFRIEAEAAAILSHPNIVPIYEVGEVDGVPYYTMQFIEGKNLADAMKEPAWHADSKLQVRKIVRWLTVICDAVHEAHLHGVIHRDLKPGNILLDLDEKPYVTDFGLAKRLERHDGLTRTDAIMGTPAFMSPEQFSASKGVTVTSDVYSLGAILYNLLAGQPPFASSDPAEAIQRLLNETPTAVNQINRFVDKDLLTITQKCLEKDPKRRYSTAGALRDDLDRWLNDQPIQARPVGPVERFMRWSRRNPLRLGVFGMACLVFVMTAGTLFLGYRSTLQMQETWRDEEYDRLILRAAHFQTNNDALGLLDSLTAAEENRDSVDEKPGWEWHYLNRRCPIELQIPKRFGNLMTCEWSDDGKRFAVVEHANAISSLMIWKFDSPQDKANDLSQFRQTIENPPDMRITLSWRAMDVLPTLSWQSQGDFIAVHLERESVYIYDSNTGSLVYSLPWQERSEDTGLKWSRDGKKLAIVGSKSFQVLDILRRFNASTFAVPESLKRSIYWDDQDEHVILVDAATTFYDSKTGQVSERWDFRTDWSPDGQRWSSDAGFGKRNSDKVVIERKLGDGVWSPNGNYLLCRRAMDFEVIDTNSGERVSQWDLGASSPVKWFPNSDRFMVGRYVSRNLRWSSKGDEQVQEETITNMAVSPSNELIAMTPRQRLGSIQIKRTDGTVYAELMGSPYSFVSLSWSPDSELLATLDSNGLLSVWDVQARKQIFEYGDPHQEMVSSPLAQRVKWSKDGRYLAMSATGEKVTVWETTSFEKVYQLVSRSVRVVDWVENPQALVMEAYTGLAQEVRKLGRTGNELDGYLRTITWEPESGIVYESNTVSTATVNCISQALSTNLLAASGGNTLYVHQLDSRWRPISSRQPDKQFSFPANVRSFCVSGSGENCFVLSDHGGLDVFVPSRNRVALHLPRTNPNALLCAVGNDLWIADGERIIRYDGSITESPSIRLTSKPTRFWKSYFLEKFFLVCMVILAPIWILLVRSTKLSSLNRWMIAAAVSALGMSLWVLSESGSVRLFYMEVQSQVSVSTWLPFLWVFFCFGTTAAIVESMKMLASPNWIIPVFAWIVVIGVCSVEAAILLWPNSQKVVFDQALLNATFLVAVYLVGWFLLMLRLVWWGLGRSASSKFRSIPFWVRFALWGSRNQREAIIFALLGELMGIGITCLGIRTYLSAPYSGSLVYAVLFGVIGLLCTAGASLTLLACWWIAKRGGWDAQMNKIPINEIPSP